MKHVLANEAKPCFSMLQIWHNVTGETDSVVLYIEYNQQPYISPFLFLFMLLPRTIIIDLYDQAVLNEENIEHKVEWVV